MNKAKLDKLIKYQGKLKDLLANPKHHPKRGSAITHKQMLTKDYEYVSKQIEDAKILGVK